VESKENLYLNYLAFKEHILAKRPPRGASEDKTRNEGSNVRSRRKSGESEESFKRRMLLGDDGEPLSKLQEEERMLDIAEQCFMRIADLLHFARRTVKQAFS